MTFSSGLNPGELEVILENFVASQEMIYGKSPFRDSLGGRFEYVLKAAHEKTGLRAVVFNEQLLHAWKW